MQYLLKQTIFGAIKQEVILNTFSGHSGIKLKISNTNNLKIIQQECQLYNDRIYALWLASYS